MSTDYKSILQMIVRLAKLQIGVREISLTYLAERSSFRVEELVSIIHLLEKEGYVITKHPTSKVTLLQPTISGYEKAREWEELALAKTPKRKILTFGKVIGASLLAVILGFLWWWLGFSPETSGITPLGATIPIRLYQKSIYPPNYYEPGGWYGFPNAPKDGAVISASDYDEADKVLQTLIPEFIPASLDGWVRITFDVENIAPSYQVNIDAVQIKIIRKSVNNPENLYFEPPHLGMGDTREFELTLNSSSLISTEDGAEIYQAKMTSDNKDVDYIYVRPGERETFSVSINLDHPGLFELTPIIKYSFRDKQSLLQATPYTVIFPKKYRLWYWDSDSMSCKGDVCTGGGGTLVSNAIILDTQSNSIEFEKETKSMDIPICFPEKKWIAFESSMVTFGYLDRLFLIDTRGEQIRVISTTDLHNIERRLAWLSDGNLLVGEPTSQDESIRDYRYTDIVINSLTLEMQIQQAGSNATMLNSNYVEKVKTCFSDNSGCIEQKADKDTDGYNGIDSQDLQHLFIVRGDVQSPFAYISDQSQIEPVISPDDTLVAYVEKKEIKNNYGRVSFVEGISVARIDGTVQWKIKDFDGWYDNLNWSPDAIPSPIRR
ncbi:MAG: hypothetical protein HONDAALG_03393 [Gammaproteobacteria bacterium]|nr:hypothetical protein [Gammaproteobacteria bacterium]